MNQHQSAVQQLAPLRATTLSSLDESPREASQLAEIGLPRETLARFSGSLVGRSFIPSEMCPGSEIGEAAEAAVRLSQKTGLPVVVGHGDPELAFLVDVGGQR